MSMPSTGDFGARGRGTLARNHRISQHIGPIDAERRRTRGSRDARHVAC